MGEKFGPMQDPDRSGFSFLLVGSRSIYGDRLERFFSLVRALVCTIQTMRSNHQPTAEAYQAFETAYDFFNRVLFDRTLPPVLHTFQRGKNFYGFFGAMRFRHEDGEFSHELAMNPDHFNRGEREILSTLVHEMVHNWQRTFGKPGRRGYHNAEWAAKMKEVGLQPSTTGRPGGKEVGERMSHYIVDGGAFDRGFDELQRNGFTIPWSSTDPISLLRLEGGEDEIPDPDDGSDSNPNGEGGSSGSPTTPKKKQTREKYRCPRCECQVWGKPGLNIRCIDCNEVYFLVHE